MYQPSHNMVLFILYVNHKGTRAGTVSDRDCIKMKESVPFTQLVVKMSNESSTAQQGPIGPGGIFIQLYPGASACSLSQKKSQLFHAVN